MSAASSVLPYLAPLDPLGPVAPAVPAALGSASKPAAPAPARRLPAKKPVRPSYPGGAPYAQAAQGPTPQPAQITRQHPFLPPAGAGAAGLVAAQSPHGPHSPTTTTDPNAPPPAATNTTGSQSGPGILENWFTQRANGTDPGFEYGMGRATDSINRQFAARGGYNSSGATGQLSDMYANAVSQREGQLDSLAGGASGEHQRRLEDMFTQGLGIANGQAGVAGAYDQAAGGSMASNQRAQIELMLQRAGVDPKKIQGQLDAMFGIGKAIAAA